MSVGSLPGLRRRKYRQEQPPLPYPEWCNSSEPFDEVCKQLDAYFQQDLTHFDLPLKPSGTPFQKQVWQALQTIPYGETCSYSANVNAIENPKACRAVGSANNVTLITIIIPCHRVIGASDNMVGYRGGVRRKIQLLQHENTAFANQLLS